MRKKILITGLIVAILIPLFIIVWRVYDLSSDYNYATAKIDIKNGDIKLINVGIHQLTSKDSVIEQIAARYGFKNVYIEKYTPQQTEKGINNYNELMEAYLSLRKGSGWKARYKREVDSVNKAGAVY